jgi:serine/threonine protein kinase
MPLATATNERRCKCGAAMEAEALGALCSACLLEAALAPASADDSNCVGANVLMDFGEYELLEELGRGGQGVVYRARQKGLNRTVALKIIGLGHWASERHLRRFRMEAEAAAQLDHPGIVPIYEIGERDGACYFSMKYVEGRQLGDEAMPVRRAAELMAKVARTVQYAHEHGVLHRDIKPGNILLAKDGEPHLTDFGLARLLEKGSNVTRTLDVLGTPSYMAPEQATARQRDATVAVDVYGLGAVFYHLLTGQPPFAGGTTYETLKLVLENEPRSPRLWNAKLDRDLETICLRCLEKTPQRRYQDALQFAEDIERWLRHEPIRARRINVVSRVGKWLRRNRLLSAAAAIVLALASLLTLAVWRNAAERPPPAGIAVLPFANLSEDKEDVSLADTIQDDVLTKLAKVASLKVISRTSVMAYRGEPNIRKIGQALRVSHVLEGSVHGVDGRVRVNAQLIDARNDTHVWAETYERNRTEVFALESEIAQQVAGQLSAKLSGPEKAAIERPPTRDLEAYELYVRAKCLTIFRSPSNSATFDELQRAAALLEQAIARDANFALAYSLLTEVNLNLYWMGGRADTERRSRAEATVQVAERLAPEAGETHLARAYFYHYGNRDYDHALAEIDTAARLLPNDADVFDISAKIERRLGRWADALRHFGKAAELSPRDPGRLNQLVVTNLLLRRFTDADRVADRGISLFPESAGEFWSLKGEAALAQANIPAARAALEHIPDKNAFPSLRFRLLYFDHNYAEAEAFTAAQWQGKEADWVRAFGLSSCLAARAGGDFDKMRSYLLATRQAYEPLLHDQPDPATLAYLGLIDAGLGRKEEAIRSGRRAVELLPVERDAVESAENKAWLAIVYAWTGEQELAIEQLSSVVNVANGPTYGDLKLNPVWDSLRDDPRFQKLLEEAAKPVQL